MWSHVKDEQLLDLVDSGGAPSVRGHVENCVSCRRRVEEAREGLLWARDVEIPEPSPLYWEAFRVQVGRRIAAEPPRRAPWTASLLTATAVLTVAVGIALRPGLPRHPAAAAAVLPAWSALPADEDEGLGVIAALGPSMEDLGTISACTEVTECIASLSDEESAELAEDFEREMRGKL
jgi:hypothetical protein